MSALPLSNNAEGGTNGTDVTTGNSGGASGDAFDAIQTDTGTSPTFDNTHPGHGALAYKFESAKTMYCQWTFAGGVLEVFGRVVLWIAAAPTGQHLYLVAFDSLNGPYVIVTEAGKLAIEDQDGSRTTGTVTVGTGQLVRIEYHFTFDASTGTMEAKLFNSVDSLTADETLTATGKNTGAEAGTLAIGNLVGSTGAAWVDDLAVNATGYPGPASGTPASGSGTFVVSDGGEVWFTGSGVGVIPGVSSSPPLLLVTHNRDGSGEVVIPCYDLNCGNGLSDSARATYKVFPDVALTVASALRTGRRIVSIYEDDELRWKGPQWGRNRSDSGDGQEASFEARGFFEVFRKRIIRPGEGFEFTSMNPWDMAEALIDYANGQADTGVTIGDRFGSPPTDRDANFDPWQTIADGVTNCMTLPDRDTDFWVDELLKWNVTRRRTGPISSLILDESIVESIEDEESFDSVATDVYATGGGSGADTLYGYATDAGLEPTYGMVTSVFNKNEQETVQSYLDEGANAYLFHHSRPSPLINSIKIRREAIDWADVQLGAWYPISFTDRFVDIQPTVPPHPDVVRPVGYYRLVGWNLALNESGKKELTFEMDQAIF